MQNSLEKAVTEGDVPFVVAQAGNRDEVFWCGSAGEALPGEAADENTLLAIFSMSKAVGSVAAMILADQGKLDYDAPVETYLPEFSEIRFLERFEGDTPVLRAPKNKTLVRHLATHTSGLAYEFWNPLAGQWMQTTESPSIISGLKKALHYPCIAEPGTEFQYGISTDWLGQVVEAVDGRRIDQFVEEEILAPLDMSDTRFELDAAAKGRLAQAHARGEDGAFGPMEMVPPSDPEFYGMGHALYSTVADYMRFLRMLLNRGALDGNRVLSAEAVDRLFANATGNVEIRKLVSLAPPLSGDLDIFPGLKKSHSLGFMRMEEDVPGMRRAGSQFWAGLMNTHYWLDPAGNTAGVIATQLLPFLDARYMALYENFERFAYSR